MHIASLPSPRLGADWGGLAVPAPHPHIPTHTTIIIIFVIIALYILRGWFLLLPPRDQIPSTKEMMHSSGLQHTDASWRCAPDMHC